MRIGRNEIIEALTEHIRKAGGEPGEWCVGTAKEQWLREMDRFKIQNSREIRQGEMDRIKIQNSTETPARGDGQIQNSRENPSSMAGLAYREAHTTYAADDAVDYLVSAFGLQLASQAERGSALQDGRSMADLPRSIGAPAMTGHGRDARATSCEAECRSALQNPAPGRIVFVYRENPLPLAAPRNAQATLHKPEWMSAPTIAHTRRAWPKVRMLRLKTRMRLLSSI